tara:strand:- start:733 stop:966 length:234 start_codon:yes stop_codon:yes gene_type:complete
MSDALDACTASNSTRAQWARETVEFFERKTIMQGEETEVIAKDLLTNLMHLFNEESIDFENVLDEARRMHQTEVEQR